jgi:DNA gyrase subunit A
MRARHHVEEDSKTGRETIVFTEIPYMVNKARLIEKIAELVKDKKIEGISELRDESDKDGLRIAVDLKRGENADVVVNNLFSQTPLENVFGINTVALVDGQPKTLNLKELLEAFVQHRREVVTRRTVYELRKARERGHVLEGLAVALANIDPVIETIKKSETAAVAKERLIETPWMPGNVLDMLERAGADACRPEDLPEKYGLRDGKYYLSPEQAQAILELRLHRLTGLEHEKLIAEYKEKIDLIAELLEILGSHERLMEVIREELEAIVEEYGDERRSEIIASRQDLTVADLIPEEEMVVTISHGGYAKTQPLDTYQAQRRGGKGKSATDMKDEDYIEHLLVVNSHETIMLFTDKGKVYWLTVFEIPSGSRQAKGRPIVNLLPLDEDEKVSTILPVREYVEGHYVFMATQRGIVKKVDLTAFARQRSSGLIAVELQDDDRLIGAAITDGECDIMLSANTGKVVRFSEADVRPMGRTARGVRGIKMADDARVISLIIPDEEGYILTASERGYGKRTKVSDFPTYNRGSQGVIGMQTTDRNGEMVGATLIHDGDEMMLISDQGTLVRTRIDEVSVLGRNTQGVRLINLSTDEKLVSVERIAEPEEVEGDDVVDADDAAVATPTQDDATPESDASQE